MYIVVDVEMFSGGVIKELAFCSGLFHAGYLFKPPMPFSQLTKEEQKKNTWLTNNFHEIHWSCGTYDYKELNFILQLFLRPEALLYAKGHEKCVFLTKLCNRPFINLEELGCPNIEDLPQDAAVCDSYGFHHAKHSHCAQRKAIIFAKWLADFHDEVFTFV